ncbi:AmmeMemoRadiSam system protein B [Candidatus Falkowbacteria bacterium]|nr:AmmeMemoRadiSam system protein B [Candidatus Falkowbacteria bacterium]OIP79076.1 MAG: hypothetical protein AUK20_02590 [Parcubacteria group bacterium CG2_30_45_37]
MPKEIRPPAVAGQFYPAAAEEITEQINGYLKQASTPPVAGEIKAIIVPHAGYDFSGQVAAYAFKLLEGVKINTAVLIGNSHTAYFDGAAIDSSDVWQTPLGQVAVDKELADKLIKADSAIKYDASVHGQDHVLEVEIPFLQVVLAGNFKIVPIMLGNKADDSYKKLAKALKDNLGENDVVVVSSDMSHYPKHEDANKIDRGALEKIKSGKVDELEKYVESVENSGVANEQTVLCGIDAVKTLLELARLSGWDKIEVLKYLNSGDVSGIGDKNRVVGYGAVAFAQIQTAGGLNREQRELLLTMAKETVESFVTTGQAPEFDVTDERLKQKQGAFVTLTKNGQLRGCIGQIVPTDEPLWQVVREMAVAACSEDGRFNPVEKSELDELEYEVSVLSAPEAIDDWKKIELGKQGVIIRKGGRSGVFLPQVATETGWTLEEFLGQLCSQKAGLSPSCYKDKDTEIQIFSAQVFK